MKNNVIAGALIALGILFGGFYIYLGINKFANKDRAVSVKGLSTREVEADYAVWPLSYAWSGNDLPALYAQLETVTERVKKHLLSLGFEESDLGRLLRGSSGVQVHAQHLTHRLDRQGTTGCRQPRQGVILAQGGYHCDNGEMEPGLSVQRSAGTQAGDDRGSYAERTCGGAEVRR